MNAEEYTAWVKRMADDAVEKLERMAKFMRRHGDETRALDIDEAIGYITAAVDEARADEYR